MYGKKHSIFGFSTIWGFRRPLECISRRWGRRLLYIPREPWGSSQSSAYHSLFLFLNSGFWGYLRELPARAVSRSKTALWNDISLAKPPSARSSMPHAGIQERSPGSLMPMLQAAPLLSPPAPWTSLWFFPPRSLLGEPGHSHCEEGQSLCSRRRKQDTIARCN